MFLACNKSCLHEGIIKGMEICVNMDEARSGKGIIIMKLPTTRLSASAHIDNEIELSNCCSTKSDPNTNCERI